MTAEVFTCDTCKAVSTPEKRIHFATEWRCFECSFSGREANLRFIGQCLTDADLKELVALIKSNARWVMGLRAGKD